MAEIIESIKSTLKSIEQISGENLCYNIPRYQRLYVWSNEQIDTLLEDLLDSCKGKKELFYLGGILIVESNHSDAIYDLIDGQQRFTTLWLLSLELGAKLADFTKVDDQLRLRFSIRESATSYFQAALRGNDYLIDRDFEDNSLTKIHNARSRIKGFLLDKLKESQVSQTEFADFVFEKVKLIVTEVPKNTDLNKLFELTNNRGLQLQHHEILKANILSHINNKQERSRFSKIWSACADMDNYVERNISSEISMNVSSAYNPGIKKFDFKSLFDMMKDRRDKDFVDIDLNNILNKKVSENEIESSRMFEYDHPEGTDDENESVRSILSFPQLLLHALRIYLFDKGNKDIHKISEKELLYTFNTYACIDDEKSAKKFIEHLWDVRVAFDLVIIKWVKVDNNDEVHLIKPLRKYNQYRKWTYYLQRQKPTSNSGFALLQSMLYHSQQITTHYWLTPLLKKAMTVRNEDALLGYLKKIDNFLFCSDDSRSLPERTWEAMNDNYNRLPSCEIIDNPDLGVQFPHYWFYKVEYILWDLFKDSIKDERWKNFRLTAKNSVEHISPQSPKSTDTNKVSNESLNTFGNLALVSRSINSEYSNLPFNEKKQRFINNNQTKFDSLKMALIYENDAWNDQLCNEHQVQVKSYIEKYFIKQT